MPNLGILIGAVVVVVVFALLGRRRESPGDPTEAGGGPEPADAEIGGIGFQAPKSHANSGTF